jgi:hypothetical protein
MEQAIGLWEVGKEFVGSELGDQRLNRRLCRIARRLSESPSASFPEALKTSAALEGFYRFINHEDVTAEAILAPHREQTVRRCCGFERVLVVHDTTEFNFTGESDRIGLSQERKRSQGFQGHFALAVSGDAAHRSLGVLGYSTHVRKGKSQRKKSRRKHHRSAQNESHRWWKLVEEVAPSLEKAQNVIHVMDREGDSYELFARLVQGGHSFVIRIAHDRNLLIDGEKEKLFKQMEQQPMVAQRQVPLSRRSYRRKERATETIKRKHPERKARQATLGIRSMSVEFPRTDIVAGSFPKSIKLHAVEVREISPPKDETPIRWMLVSNQPIDNEQQILTIVDDYRGRWRIEEYFKALKTGCSYERRQMDNSHSLMNVLALSVPIACRLLLLRTLAHEDSSCSASEIFADDELQMLTALAPEYDYVLSAAPSISDAMQAIARLGGHIKYNGRPGWQVLWKGYQRLRSCLIGWRLRDQIPNRHRKTSQAYMWGKDLS